MMALLIKDWRLSAPATVFWVLVFVFIPSACLGVEYFGWDSPLPMPPENLANAMVIGAFAALGTSMLVVPAFGAIAFARERRDRSADFLASMPVGRGQVVLSKAITLGALNALPWVGTVLLFGVIWMIWGFSTWSNWQDAQDWRGVMRTIAIIQFALVGYSWLLSTLLRSEVLAASMTILTAVVATIAFGFYYERLASRALGGEAAALHTGAIGCLCVGALGIIGGTAIALRRVSP